MRPLTRGVVCALVFLAVVTSLSVPARASVVRTEPPDGATDVPVTAPIVVVFSDPVDTSTVTWMINPAIAFTVFWDPTNTILTAVHAAPFLPCTVYDVAIVAPDPPYEWSFTTECPAPFLVATAPPDGAAGVDAAAIVVVRFSEPMDTATVTVTFAPSALFLPTWSEGDTVLTLSHPSLPLRGCTVYSVSVDGKGKTGIPLAPGPAPNPWSFETACTMPLARDWSVHRLGADAPGGDALGAPVTGVSAREGIRVRTESGRDAVALPPIPAARSVP